MAIVPNEPLAMLFAFMLTQAVAWTTFGLVPFVRQYLPGVAILLFVLLSIPSSGGAIPYQLAPGFFRWLHPVLPLGNLIEALRGIFYFNGVGLLRPTLVLCAWLVAGAALIGGGTILYRRQDQRAANDDEAEGTETPVEDASFQVPVAHGAQPADGDVLVRSGLMLVGKVTEGQDEPLAGATVTITDMQGHQLMRTRTNHDGVYAATELPEDFVTVLLTSQGRVPAAARVLVRSGKTARRNFVLPAQVAGSEDAHDDR